MGSSPANVVMARWSVFQSGERKSSGSAARSGESGQRKREETAGGEAKGARGKEKTGRKPEWVSEGGVTAAPPTFKQTFKNGVLSHRRRSSSDWPRSRLLQRNEKLLPS